MSPPFTILTDEEEREFHRLQRYYWQEALRCEDAKAYLSGCIMLGAVLEALLILMVNVYPEEAEQTGKIPTIKGRPKPLINWSLAEALRVAEAAHWLPSTVDLQKEKWNGRNARVGKSGETIQKLRNFVHPARYAKDHYGQKITQKYLKRQFEALLVCRSWLADKNNTSLLEHMKSEGIL